jgi:hypothetical protein
LSEGLDDGRDAETHATDGLRRRLAEDTLFRYKTPNTKQKNTPSFVPFSPFSHLFSQHLSS